MATIKAVVRIGRTNKKNECKVEFALCHQRKTVYLDSGMTACVFEKGGQKCVNFENGMFTRKEMDYLKKNEVLVRCLSEYEDRLGRIKNIALKNVEQVREAICSDDSYHHDLREVPGVLTVVKAADAFIRELKDDGRMSYAQNIQNAIDRFVKWSRGDLPLEDLSSALLNDFQRWLRKQPSLVWKGKKVGLVPRIDECGEVVLLSEDSVSKYMQAIKTIVNRNINIGRVSYSVHPFAGVRLRRGRVKICDVGIEEWQKLMQMSGETRQEEVSLDCMKLSFYMGGMNVGDICRVRWNGESVTLTRRKVEGRMSQKFTLPVLENVRGIVDKYIQKDGRLDFGYVHMNSICSHALKRIAERAGVSVIDGNVCMTTARKTWAQFAGLIGVQRYVVDYCMGHVPGNEIADHYQRAMAMQAAAACRAVADFVDNPEKWKPILEYRAMMSAGVMACNQLQDR